MPKKPLTVRGIYKALRAAGFIQASPYSIWGRKVEGFLIIRSTLPGSTTVDVTDTAGSQRGPTLVPEYAKALAAAGFTVKLSRDQRWLEVNL